MYKYNLAESFGVYKWSIDFENIHNNSVMYTNITGGDWKNIINPKSGITIHIHRLEEERADLIVYLEKFNILLIAEAKDSIEKLYNDLNKHVDVMNNLLPVFANEKKGWSRKNSTSLIIPTLLWCSDKIKTSSQVVDSLFNTFSNSIKNKLKISLSLMIGLEVVRDEKMTLTTHSTIYHNNTNKVLINDLTKEIKGITGSECRVNNQINF